MAVNDVYRLRVVCYSTTLAQIAINNSYWKILVEVGVMPGPGPQAIATEFDAVLSNPYKAMMPATARYRGVSTQLIVGGPPPVPSTSIVNDNVGTAAGNALPAQDSFVLAWKTALSGRHQQGRIYPGFPAASFNDANGNMNGAGITANTALGAAYFGNVVVVSGGWSATFELCVRSKIGLVNTYNPVVVVIPRPRWGTQRRRGNYGRLNPLPF